MSEAGFQAAKPGHQWRPMESRLGRELGRRPWDSLAEGVLDLPNRDLGGTRGESGSWPPKLMPGCRLGFGRRQKTSEGRITRSARG